MVDPKHKIFYLLAKAKVSFQLNYQSEVDKVQTDLTNVIANEFDCYRAVLLIARHDCWKFWRDEVGDVVSHFLVACALDCKFQQNISLKSPHNS